MCSGYIGYFENLSRREKDSMDMLYDYEKLTNERLYFNVHGTKIFITVNPPIDELDLKR